MVSRLDLGTWTWGQETDSDDAAGQLKMFLDTGGTLVDASLRRLALDHVDLWQLHAWGGGTPIEESLAALDTAVASGRTRYAGISNYSGWQTAAAAGRGGAGLGQGPARRRRAGRRRACGQ
jgi:aryl-alcohol dehydrogenase-like predicted oxidoreductase